MTNACEVAMKQASGAPLGVFERYLTLWVFLCIVAGTVLGLVGQRRFGNAFAKRSQLAHQSGSVGGVIAGGASTGAPK